MTSGADGTFEIGDGTYAGSSDFSHDHGADEPPGRRPWPEPPRRRTRAPHHARILDKDPAGPFPSEYISTIIINNVAPTAVLSNSGPVNQGATATVSFSNQFDPSPQDIAAGFPYAYDFDNDGLFDIISSPFPSATVPASFPRVRRWTHRGRADHRQGRRLHRLFNRHHRASGASRTQHRGLERRQQLGANWTDPANWDGGVAPTAGDDLVFSSGSARLSCHERLPRRHAVQLDHA